MFMTQRSEEVQLGRVFEGEQYWRIVEWPLTQPFFHITVEILDFSGTYSRCYMVSGVRGLEGLLRGQWLLFQVKSVMLVSPPELNGGENPQMDLLREIRLVRDREQRSTFSHIYELADGRQYICGDCTDPERLEDDCIIFSEVDLRGRTPRVATSGT